MLKSKVEPVIFECTRGKNLCLKVLDQRLIPNEKKYLELSSHKDVINSIKDMAVRGAPLIGITAAYGLALAADELKKKSPSPQSFKEELKKIGGEIKNARPTAINLIWAIDLILSDISILEDINEMVETAKKRACWIHEDDKDRCNKIGLSGAKEIEKLISSNQSILTICNTGSLATGGIGTAFGVILTIHKKNPDVHIFAAETRPRQQGARLTTFECVENNIKCTLVSDTACGYLMRENKIGVVITGADRIAANGDTANKIGTYQLAVLAKEHKIPFYVAAPLSTFDLSIKTGDEIPIEERSEEEVKIINGSTVCEKGVKVFNPAFDITPCEYITGIITDKGILKGDLKKEIFNAFNTPTIA